MAMNREREIGKNGLPVDIEPVTEPDPRPGSREATKETHPAYAMIGCSRVSASPGEYLFGSDFRHQHFMRVRIFGAELHRDLAHDWHHARGEYLEISLSEAQWAAFVSSPNMGDGVPCTLNFRAPIRAGEDSGHIPGIARIQDRRKQFRDEAAQRLERVDTALAETAAMLNDPEVTMPAKTRKALQAKLDKARQNLGSNLNYVLKSFDEHVETTVEKAKTEVNAYLTATVQRAGLAAIRSGQVLALDMGTEQQPALPAAEPEGGQE